MNLQCQALKAFVLARDFALSKRFYAEMGFVQRSEVGGVAYFHRDSDLDGTTASALPTHV